MEIFRLGSEPWKSIFVMEMLQDPDTQQLRHTYISYQWSLRMIFSFLVESCAERKCNMQNATFPSTQREGCDF